MSKDYNDNKTIQAQSSETISGGGSGATPDDIDYVKPAEVSDQIYIMDTASSLNGFFVRMQKLLGYNIFS